MKKKILIVFLFIFVISAFTIFQKLVNRTVMNDENAYGNTAGNLLNGGAFCEKDNKIYFSNPNDDGSLYEMNNDCTGFLKLHSDKAAYINTAGPYIYYSRINNTREHAMGSIFIFDNTGIYRIRKKGGSHMKQLYKDPVGMVNLSGNYLYYQHYQDKKGLELYRVKIDGKDNAKISGEGIVPASISDGAMYYAGVNDDHNINTLDLSSGASSVLAKANAVNCIKAGNAVYYISQEDNYGIVKCNLDGSKKQLIVKEQCFTFNLSESGKYLYYQVDGGDHNGFCRMNLQTRKSTVLKKGDYSQIYVTSNYVFFTEFKTGKIYMVPAGEQNTVTPFNPPVKKK